ncbi:2-amino-5-chloromuconate deaminase CnbZ [Propionibacteriaceae bacterium Y2011]|uniref:2-amino-5-chloromuconate deaminase CnbZ n=1 Tax=Microlunatus sp. Y2014 TaxID=3418488 RepID=UPI003B4C18D8
MTAPVDTGHGYDYLPGVGQYSVGVIARPGHAITRVRLAESLPHDLAFELISAYLTTLGLAGGALCSVELRSPEQLTDEGFADYNRRYLASLDQLDIDTAVGSPVARSMVVPVQDPPEDVSVYAFGYARRLENGEAVALAGLDRTFVVSGSAEVKEGKGSYTDHIESRGDVSPAGLARKGHWVVGEMGRRLKLLGTDWSQVTGTHVYSVRDVGSVVSTEVHPVTGRPVTWQLCAPPIIDLEYEMDCRRIGTELVLEPAAV